MLDVVASTALAMRRNGTSAKARERKLNVLAKYVRSGSNSAVGDRLVLAEAGDPVRVAQGLLEKVNMWHNGEVTPFGYVHVSIGLQCLSYIGAERVGYDLLAADAEAGVPPSRLVEECTAITVFANSFGSALSDVGDCHATNATSLASAIL
jgi:hypothetical protein